MGAAATKPKYSKPNILDTSSKSINETVNGSHEYVIKGYSLAKGMGVGKFIKSSAFTVGGYEWGIYFYPHGHSLAQKDFVSVFIVLLLCPSTDVRALFELKLLDQSGKGRHNVDSHFDSPLETGPFTLKSRGSIWGFPQSFKRSSLENSDFLKDDCLVIQCTVGVVGTRVEGGKHCAIPVPPSDMIQSLKSLLESGTGSDVTFQVGDKKFKAHKLVVATRSLVFKAQFFGLVGNPDMKTVVIEDFDPIVFKAMLLFLYTDELPEAHELFDSDPRCTSTTVVQHLLAAADRFDLARLKLMCEAKLCEEITTDTGNNADLSRTTPLHATQNSVMQSEGFAYLEESCPSLLLELLETVAVVDNRLSSVIFNWKRNGNKSNTSTGLSGIPSKIVLAVCFGTLCCLAVRVIKR
ncbi:hypothetical protein C5167_048904 [Papaver somniferum]|uniref:BTB domain-containing protein n=1 Tax=Papaver somniferum TaxID=3469 RepID=A0A4Y7KKP2_PAPSO|nr:hypothetical protein C5167_048904 [Papaver somniferum]